MKKALGILSVLVLITVMMISCNAEQKLDDTVGVSFNVSSSRELSVANESFVAVDSPDLTWYYHGEKKTDTQFITGQSSSMTEGEDGYWTLISKGNKLATKTVEFSQGQWSFKIKAVKTDGTQMYYGETNGNVLLTKGNNTISISVSPFVSGVKGTLVINSVFIDPKDAESENVAPNKLFVNGVEKTFVVDNGGKSISFTESVDPGTYTVEVKRTGEDSGIVLASASKTVVVYSGLTTTISGSVEEDTTSGKFDPKPIKPEGTETVTVPESGDAVVEFVNVTPSMEADKSTTVTIPSAVVPSTSNPVTLDIVVKDSESVADNSFNVTGDNGVAASISLTMKNGDTAITNFDSNKVTVETYIETGLSGVTVKYNGTTGNPDSADTTYDPVTGKLTFKTTHFSEFFVEAEIVAKIGDEEYLTLQKAFDAAEDGDTVILLVNVDPTQTLVVSKNITLDMKGKTISNTRDIWKEEVNNWSLISVRGGNLTVTGEGSLRGKANDCYALDVMDGGKLVIENGTFVGNCHAVYVYEGSLLVEGGEFSVIQKYSASYPDEYVLNCYDSSYKNGTASIVVKGGKFHGFNPANCRAEGVGTSFIVDWYSSKNIGTESIYEVGSAVNDEEITISSVEGLVEFARLVNNDGYSFNGQTIKLVSDINLNSVNNWEPIGTNADGANKFKGIFDGQGHTISNMTVDQGDDVKYRAAGFFGALNGTAKNIIFDNATVTSISAPNGKGNTDNGIAVVAGSIYTSGSIEVVTVKNSRVSGNRYVGGISGYTYGSVKNCTVEDTTVTSTPDNLTGSYDNGDKAGGVVGAFWHESSYVISGNTVNNVTVKGYRDIGGIVGYANGNVTGNTVNGLTLIQDYSVLTTPRTTVEAVIGRHDGFVVDASNTANNVTVIRVSEVSNNEELNQAISAANKGDTVTINVLGNVTLDNGIANEGNNSRNITFIGNGSQTVDVITNTVNAEGGQLNYQRGSSFTFENLTIQAGEGSFDGIVCNELTFNNCTIKGKLTLFGKATFINCTFENTMDDQYSIWTWGGTDVTFQGCTFKTNGKAILLYGGASGSNPTNLIVNSCTFNDRKSGAAGKAAIEIGNDYNATYTLTVNNATVNGFAAGKNTGSTLWANKNSMDRAHLSVTVDGEKVYGN